MNTNTPSSSSGILILEDEFIISDMLAGHLRRGGYEIAGQAKSFTEAATICHDCLPDLALLDIRISGDRTGIEFAHYLRDNHPSVPYIFLTSQADKGNMDAVTRTRPSGCLSKPIQIRSLLSMIEIALFNHRSREQTSRCVHLRDGKATHRVMVNEITYLEADHVYVVVHFRDRSTLMLRTSLSELTAEIGDGKIMQTHRSYAVNLVHVTRFEREQLYVGDRAIPVSRSRRSEVFERL